MTTDNKTESKTENTPTPAANDNKAVFGPLGKYAVVAVIMVSIIVTTAIMLDRQLNSADQQIAAIEDEIAEMHAVHTDTAADKTIASEITSTEPVISTENSAAKEEAVSKTAAVEAAPYVTPDAEVLVTQESTATPAAGDSTSQTKTATAAQFELATVESTRTEQQTRHTLLAKENQARIDAYKLEQKQHMTEMFARIKTLESQQLDRYKSNQDNQIARLRGQIAQQQQMIEALVLRNKDLFELRAANVQRNQANREQTLNRI